MSNHIIDNSTENKRGKFRGKYLMSDHEKLFLAEITNQEGRIVNRSYFICIKDIFTDLKDLLEELAVDDEIEFESIAEEKHFIGSGYKVESAQDIRKIG